MELSIVINDIKTGKSYAKKLNETESANFFHKKIRDKLDGGKFGFKGYEFEIRGGSDKSGFPMRFDFDSSVRKKALLSEGPGVKISRKGMRKRKTIRGNTISEDIAQVNLKVLKPGEKSLDSIFGKEEAAPKTDEKPKEEPKKEEKPVEKPKKEVKKEPEKKLETPKKEKKEEVKEEKKEEPKPEEKAVEEKK
ncbi:30S ribosomal protein S6e [archaeon]|nr:30S ribosomal protein S6e [archaeon]